MINTSHLVLWRLSKIYRELKIAEIDTLFTKYKINGINNMDLILLFYDGFKKFLVDHSGE